MKIVVLVKQVPDTWGDRKIDTVTGLVDRASGDQVADEIGERIVEAALTIQAGLPGTTVTVITMGSASAVEAIRKALAMGADNAIHVLDDRLVGADLALTSEVLAASIKPLNPDLVLTGNVSTDGGCGVMAAMLAEHLGLPQVTNLTTISSDGLTVSGARLTDFGMANVSAKLPAVASGTEALPDPRFPAFKGIIAAKKKPIDTKSTEGLGVDLAGANAARAVVVAAVQRPARSAGVKIIDDGEGGKQLADYLVAQNLA